MPGSGFNSTNMKIARDMLEACRFSYKMFAQTCTYPMDPFFESTGKPDDARTRLMASVHAAYKTSADVTKFDPVDYDLITAPNPSKGVVYRAGYNDNRYILFQPRALDRSISEHCGFDLSGQPVQYGGGNITTATGTARCGYFQGKTGMTKTWKQSGWPSWLGAVIYDPALNRVTVVFRGSRSGNAGRALTGAKFHSVGSPDWVTDMNILKGEEATKFHGAIMACGFYLAYESCKQSLVAAYRYAVGGAKPDAIYFTGHSLGGALAQLGYLDFVAGDTMSSIGVGRSHTWIPVQCFPLSAPPVIHGRSSHLKLAVDADVSQILHYFCEGDLVHCSRLVNTGLTTKTYLLNIGNKVLEVSHPLTEPVHIGSEIPLGNPKGFPDAHEPSEVFHSLHNVKSCGAFWPLFEFNHTAPSGPFISNLSHEGDNMREELMAALANSISPDRSLARAMQWKEVIKKDLKADLFVKNLLAWQTAVDVSEIEASKRSGKKPSKILQSQLDDMRALLIKGSKDSGSATSSAYWTLLQGLSAVQEQIS